MRAEKTIITQEYLAKLQASPFFIVVDYKGLKVGPINALRKRLRAVGAELRVVKNSLFAIAAKEAGVDLGAAMTGQRAAITGQKDISAAAKVVKTFRAEFEKPQIQFGYLNNLRLESADILKLADLPSMDVLRSQFVGLLKTPVTRFVQLINTPASQLARVLKAKSEKT
jgi:large subunit ribosomal protein L10